MIGFNELGRKGNLGNQMFQYASLRGIAANRGFDWKIPPIDATRVHGYDLFRLFEMPGVSSENIGYVPFPTYFTKRGDGVNSTGFAFDQELFAAVPDNVNINAFLQSPRYFEHIEGMIKSDFKFKPIIASPAQSLIESLGGDVIALHVRRGDYVRLRDYHQPLSLPYYEEALSLLPELPVVICTNDKEWVKSEPFFTRPNFTTVDLNDYGEELAVFTLASNVVMANSTFSWWGAWLSQAKSIIAPKIWFGPKLKSNSLADLYDKDWVLI